MQEPATGVTAARDPQLGDAENDQLENDLRDLERLAGKMPLVEAQKFIASN